MSATGVAHRMATVARIEQRHGVPVVVVTCPWCPREHTHAWPADLRDGSVLRRAARCGKGLRDYSITVPEVDA